MGIYPPPKLGRLRRRDVPEGLISDMRGVSARCLFLPLADIGCGTFMSTRPRRELPVKKHRIDCVDCGVDTYAVERVRDKVWTAAGMKPHGGRLCAGCLERRIGRPL